MSSTGFTKSQPVLNIRVNCFFSGAMYCTFIRTYISVQFPGRRKENCVHKRRHIIQSVFNTCHVGCRSVVEEQYDFISAISELQLDTHLNHKVIKWRLFEAIAQLCLYYKFITRAIVTVIQSRYIPTAHKGLPIIMNIKKTGGNGGVVCASFTVLSSCLFYFYFSPHTLVSSFRISIATKSSDRSQRVS